MRNSNDLTPREREVAVAVIKHRRQPKAADSLSISVWTLRNHLKNIRRKLNLDAENTVFSLMIAAGIDFSSDLNSITPESFSASPPKQTT